MPNNKSDYFYQNKIVTIVKNYRSNFIRFQRINVIYVMNNFENGLILLMFSKDFN